MRDATRSVETSRGDTMEFITFEDEYGLWECTLFPRSCRRGVGTLGAWGPYLVDGLVDEQYGAVTVNAHRLRLLPVQ
jgi:DNA polymerase III alpha subunit